LTSSGKRNKKKKEKKNEKVNGALEKIPQTEGS
jgi:hypothetical protein